MKRLVSIVAVLVGAASASADARPVPAAQWDTGTQLTLAQVMVGEADWHEPDHVAIAYVLTKRWQHYRQARGPITFKRYMQLYSSTMKVDTERARWVRSLPWGKLEGPHEERWSKVIDLVKAWGAGKVADPCPEAEHWGGAMDRPGRKWQPISCGMTKNIFYGARDSATATRGAGGAKAKAEAASPRDDDAPRAKRAPKAAKKIEQARTKAPEREHASKTRRASAASKKRDQAGSSRREPAAIAKSEQAIAKQADAREARSRRDESQQVATAASEKPDRFARRGDW